MSDEVYQDGEILDCIPELYPEDAGVGFSETLVPTHKTTQHNKQTQESILPLFEYIVLYF
jgi:hypothetical protein